MSDLRNDVKTAATEEMVGTLHMKVTKVFDKLLDVEIKAMDDADEYIADGGDPDDAPFLMPNMAAIKAAAAFVVSQKVGTLSVFEEISGGTADKLKAIKERQAIRRQNAAERMKLVGGTDG